MYSAQIELDLTNLSIVDVATVVLDAMSESGVVMVVGVEETTGDLVVKTEPGAESGIDRMSNASVTSAVADGVCDKRESGERDALRLERIVWEHMQKVLGLCGGNKSETARRLGMTRAGFLRKLKRPTRGR